MAPEVPGTTKHSPCNPCTDTWHRQYCIVLQSFPVSQHLRCLEFCCFMASEKVSRVFLFRGILERCLEFSCFMESQKGVQFSCFMASQVFSSRTASEQGLNTGVKTKVSRVFLFHGILGVLEFSICTASEQALNTRVKTKMCSFSCFMAFYKVSRIFPISRRLSKA